MLKQPMMEKLLAMRLLGMAEALLAQEQPIKMRGLRVETLACLGDLCFYRYRTLASLGPL